MLISFTPSLLEKITGGAGLGKDPGQAIAQISIDSRQVLHPQQNLFVALKGAKADGISFVPELLNLGVSYFLVDDQTSIPSSWLDRGYFIQVKDTRIALQSLATYQRVQFTKPVVGITGSNGKTIVKEWLGQVLSQQFAVAKSPKSYNSQVGVPLSIFGIQSYHQVALLEAGVSKTGDMDTLAKIIQPGLGIFTNIGSAHEEGFPDIKEKIAEKLKLFAGVNFLLYCKDHDLLAQEIEQQLPTEKRISWSKKAGAEYLVSWKNQETHSRIVVMKSDGQTFTFQVPFTDQASLENVTQVILASLSLGQEVKSIQEGLSHLMPVDMRLTLKPGLNDSLLIDDTYNNDLAGLKVALEFLSQQRPKRSKILIISDLLQQGLPEKVYKEVADLIQSYGIDQVIGVGTQIQHLETLLGKGVRTFSNTEQLLLELQPEQFQNDLILITGAREYTFERVVNRLQQRIHGTTLEINLNALTHNFNFYKRQLAPSTRVMVMVKAFAYGGGAAEIANHLQTLGADYLAVAYTDEGVSLRKQGIQLPIMVLNPVEESFDLLSQYQLEPVVFSPEFFRKLGAYVQHQSLQLSIHLDLDTGMNRLGFEQEQLVELMDLIQQYPQLQLASVYTHLVGADEEVHDDFSLHQLQQFQEMSESICSILSYKPLRHALNSAGIVRYPDFQLDMVRLGIGLYGVEVTGKHDRSLKAVSTLKTTISQVKTLAAGATVGYSRKGSLPEGGRIATLALGYADGYDRRFSQGKGYVLIDSKKAPVIGNVCMDMVMVDVSAIPGVKAGDEAIVYGEEISLKELADCIGTIPYELLTNISGRVKRVYYLD
ncbi:MAG: bifunctional UDP-N-acetylmuramoyl-tripeptide:D-alanyl-D-alanine ligase/alanine racemase [Algoriphagus sp.]|uniref:bifunctional UDP-N-acetylmuramoyl-tripeptide:D-alanyl-D-alanine ligase/alanine racemase n=1 Tax=Algoriphagus sp. TaxID=1872435 RepID=UPI002754A494|nr:bifunctional UDP-N-acetylmuramoyl-tripeptide:D-alanyl-D-alanine ligase/alanine racemase [Algoriphagus sp.]MDP4747035.1 bifunctional UDP-N-acetylmuramoyl-tripeptide:D-alanyl-D-alanine ligase/alanine racemase [Algoriphagus sp.]MDP4904027.1 bifunctional UDP-N-acetylmuramoyl-tripeptide:D-alanyl-D-alanine ligase/alanine racemase [Algoriphagus sp.]